MAESKKSEGSKGKGRTAKGESTKGKGDAKTAGKVEGGTLDLAAEEKKLREAYPEQKIVRGSLRDAGAVPEFGNKRTVEIHCQRTNKVFRVATSDLHQVKYSKEAIKEIRLERRKEQRKAKRKPAKAVAGKSEGGKSEGGKTKPKSKPAARKSVKVATPQPSDTEEESGQQPDASTHEMTIPSTQD